MYKEKVPKTLNTKIVEETNFSKVQLTCEIVDVKIIDPGIFRSKYSCYVVKTLPEGWVAERKFGDFVKLREILKKCYPGYVVPPVPSKSEKKVEKHDVEKRGYYFEKFLNDLATHPVLKNSSFFISFLSITSEKEYEAKVKTFAKYNAPKDVSDFVTLEGVAKITYNKPLAKYCNSLLIENNKLKEYQRELYFYLTS